MSALCFAACHPTWEVDGGKTAGWNVAIFRFKFQTIRCWLTRAVTWSKHISASALVYLPPFFPKCVLEVPRPTCVYLSVCPQESHEAYVQLPYRDFAQLTHTHIRKHTHTDAALSHASKGWPLDGISTTAWNIRTKYSPYFSLCFFVFINSFVMF